MCGICGIYNFTPAPVREREIYAMNALLYHRGPDEDGFYFGRNTALGMRRLAIIDRDGGKQPVYNEDRTVVAVVNGEIYNYRDIRKALVARGHHFATESDSEVIVHLYEAAGADFPVYLRGMFSIALYDIKRREIFIVRDRIGKKPLYYSMHGHRLVFSSELTSLMAADGIPRWIDMQALDMFLSLQCVPAPMSIYREVRKLPPACILHAMPDGRAEIKKYWDLPEKISSGHAAGDKIKTNGGEFKDLLQEKKEQLFKLAEESVRIRLESEVPLGAFLSGGLDSSVVVALMARVSGKPVRTFSVGFREEEFSELPYARAVAEKYGTEHTEFIVEDNILWDLERIAYKYGEPFADPSFVPSYFISRETRKNVTVALNGDGGDEVFGGYNRYRAIRIDQSFFSHIPSFLKKILVLGLSGFPKEAPFGFFWKAEKFLQISKYKKLSDKYLYARSFLKPEDFENLCTREYRERLDGNICRAGGYMAGLFRDYDAWDGELSATDRMIRADFHSWLPDCLMTKMDIASMSNSLEARSPLLDHKLVEFAWLLPDEMKIHGFGGRGAKYLFRQTFADLLPEMIRTRGKMGFGIPLGRWFRGSLRKRWAETCLSEKALKRGLFKKKALEKLFEDHCRGRRDNGCQLWTLMLLEIWFETFAGDFKL